MAIVQNMWLKNTKQKLGNTVLYQAMGQTRQRELATSVSNPRTSAQMGQRVKWANLVNFYRINAGWMKFAYETKKQNQSEYNKFMSLNVANARIYLTKALAAQGACVVDAYQMTQGSLASVEVSRATNGWNTNIFMTDTTNFDQESTVAEFTQLVLPENPALREGDQISFLRFTQQTNSSTGIPYVVVRKYEVVLNSNDTRKFYDFMPFDYIGTGSVGNNNCLSVEDSGNAGGFLLCISRTVGGKTYVSTQSIIVANNSSLIDAYSSQAAMQAAIDSYGESTEPFLTSTTADENQQANVRPSVVAVKIGTNTYTPGSSAPTVTLASGTAVEITMSQDLTGSLEDVFLKVWKDGELRDVLLTNGSVNNNKVTGTIPAAAVAYSGGVLGEAQVVMEEDYYRGVFVVPNSATQGGLE